MKNKKATLATFMLIILTLPVGYGQARSIPLTQTLAKPIELENVPLGSFIVELSAKSGAAICVEDLWIDNHDSFDDILVTFSSRKGESIEQILERFQLLYPQLSWRSRDGIIIFRAVKLGELRTDPMDVKATETTINGTFDDVRRYLAAGIPGFNPAIVETKGAINGQLKYDINITGEMTVRDILIALTKKYGLRWHAGIRSNKSGDDPGARVILSFSNGRIPVQVADETKP